MEGHKSKKPTKKELIESIPKVVEQDLKKNYIKNMAQGFELANQMMLDYINSGHGIVEVKSFIEKNLSQDGKDAMSKVLEK
jgi:hypothetical protein